MDNWDEAKLEEVVNKKHGEANKKITNQTTIVSILKSPISILVKLFEYI